MFCQSCGEILPDGAHFCPKCGQSCAAQVEIPDNINFSFDDELTPVDKETEVVCRKTTTDKETSTPEKKKPAATHTDAPAIGSIEWRYWNENGSHNGLAEYYDGTLFTIPFVPNGDDIDMPLMSNNDVIIPGPVGQFSIGKNTRRNFYLNEDYQLIACDLNGKNKVLIAGGNNEHVIDFVLNEDQLFLILQAKDDEKSIFQISQSLDTSTILKKGYSLRGLAADQNYLYYIDGTALTQRDLKSGTEKVILDRTGLNTFQMYNGYLVLTVSDNIFSQHDADNYILLIDPSRMLQRKVAQVAAKNVNCYWDHVFYTDVKNEYIWTISLNGGEPHLLRSKASSNLSIACGQLFFVDCASVRIVSINLQTGEETNFLTGKTAKSSSDGYILPPPKDLSGRKKPGYIVSSKKKAPEESKPSEDIKTAAVNREQEKTASPSNADSANAENSEGITEEIKEIKKKEYSTEMDQLWRSKPFKDVFLYNFVKVLLEFLFPLFIGIVMWAGGSIQIFFERHIDSSLLLIITGLILIIVGIAAIILIAVGMIYICISLNEKISGAEGEAIKKKYTPFGINDSYTPIGIRGGRNAVAVIVCWGSAFILLILLADIFTL